MKSGPASDHGAPEAAASPTRGFLFADLRGYTPYLEQRGAAAAAELLTRYYAMVREAVARYRGAEIKTEGDSFYVVFSAVSAAVQCGLAITAGARAAASDATGDRAVIRVGVGIHAGETVDTPEGYVGSPVNIAQRICSVAPAGQVLVSDTVRALTQTVLPVTFTPFGRRQLKGVSEPLMLYAAVAEADAGGMSRAVTRRRRLDLARWGALAAAALLIVAGAVWWQTRSAAGLPPGTWTIGVHAPLTGEFQPGFGQGQADGVKLAIDEVNATGVLGNVRLALDVRDEADYADTQPTLDAVTAWAADPRVLAIVGPALSPHAEADIPITNRAGLLMCSPAATDPGLTKPRFGGLDLRSAFPTRTNFVRLATSDDIQGPAAAAYAYNDLQLRSMVVVDDTSALGRAVADSFQRAFEALEPGVASQLVSRRAVNPGTADFAPVIDAIHSNTGDVRGLGVFFGGFTDSGAAELKRAADEAFQGKVFGPTSARMTMLSWDALRDGSGADDGSYIQKAGPDAANSYATGVSIAPVRADFDARYRSAYGHAPDQYAGAAYACAQVVIDALRQIASAGVDASHLREAVRAYVADTTHRFDTAVGNVGFDANGDSLQQFVTLYKVDTGAIGGKGDWIVVKQQDFGPAP